MTSEAKTEITVQDGGAVAAWQKHTQAILAFLAAQKTLTDEERKAAQVEQELNQIRGQVLRSLKEEETASQKYGRQIGNLNRLKSASKLTEQEYARAVKLTRTEFEKTSQSGQAALQSAALGVGKFAMAITGVGGVIGGIAVAARLLKREWENLKESQKSAADRQVDVVQARDEAIQNIGADPEMANGKADAAIEQASDETGATRRSLWKALSGAASFKGKLSNKQALEAIVQSAKLSPKDDAAMQKNTTAQLQLMQQDKTVTPQMAMGFILQAKEASPTITNESFAQHVVPAIRQGQKFGMTARESAALNATIGASIGDEEGRVTGTAQTSLEKQLAEAMPKVEGGTIAQLAALQTPEYAAVKRKLLGVFDKEHKSNKAAGLDGEAKAFMTMIELVRGGDSQTSQELQANLKKLPEIHAAAPHFKKVVDNLNADPMRQNMLLQNQLAAGQEGLELGNIPGAKGAIAREGLAGLLKAAGISKLGQDAAGLAFEASTGGGQNAPIEQLQKQLRNRAAGLAVDQVAVSGGLAYGDGMGGDAHESVPTTNPERRRASEGLMRVAKGLDKLIELAEKNNQDTKETKENTKPAPPAGGKANTKPIGKRAAEGGQRP